MKKIVIIILAIMSISSCSSDTNSSNTEIVGQWQLKQINYYGLEGGNSSQSTVDYSDQNIIYNFKVNGVVTISGENPGIIEGDYDYSYGEDYLGGSTDPKILLVKIDNIKYTYSLKNGEMTLGKSYVDGPDFVFVKK